MIVTNVFFSLVLLFVGIAIGIPGYFTWSRRWPGMIAGFNPDRCTDVDGLTRRVGTAGIALGGLYLLAAAVAYRVPESLVAVSAAVAIGSVVGLGVTMSACARFTRR
jgi:predicted anti-sigma-YlaC factor YlaD